MPHAHEFFLKALLFGGAYQGEHQGQVFRARDRENRGKISVGRRQEP